MRTRQRSKCGSLAALMLGAAFVLAPSPLPRAAENSLGTAVLATAAQQGGGSRQQ